MCGASTIINLLSRKLMSFKKLLPTLNRILVKKIEPQTKTSSGIILQKAESNLYATVIETGPGNITEKGDLIKLTVQKGDTVLLPDYGGVKVKLGTEEFLLFRDTDILGKME